MTVREALQAMPANGLEPLRRALREAAAAARGPDWPEQAWDSYWYERFERTEWCVTVPLACLPLAREPDVPVAAAERILGLPEIDPATLKPWERPPAGRYYRRYWAQNKRFLALVADIAARFPEAGGRRLGRELLHRVKRLDRFERPAVEWHLASLGLLADDPLPLAAALLESADADELGARGELVLHALQRLDALQPEQRRAVLQAAEKVARATTEFVASNPYAAVVEALDQAAAASVEELDQLLLRAARLRIQDWSGWQRALLAAGRAVTGLAARGGAGAVAAVLARARRYEEQFPALEAMIHLAAARGLPAPDNVAHAHRAIAAGRVCRGSVEAVRVEIAAARLLADLGAEGAVGELRAAARRWLGRSHTRPGRVALREVAAQLAELDPGDGALVAEAAALAEQVPDAAGRWWVEMTLAAAPGARPEQAAEALEQARRAARRWLVRRPPLASLAPLAQNLAEAAGDPRVPAVRQAVGLVGGLLGGTLAPRELAAAVMALGPLLDTLPLLDAVAATATQLAEDWWALPCLALVGDGAAAVDAAGGRW